MKIPALIPSLLKDAFAASMEMYKVMIPVIILVRVLQEYDLIQYLAWPLKPVMALVGLPAEMGLVWATAILNNIYTGLVVLASLIGDNPLTTAQATVLAVLMLLCHAMPIECGIARKSGARFLFQGVMRLVGSFALAFILSKVYAATGALQEPAVMAFSPDPMAGQAPLGQWAVDKLLNLATIYGVILGLLTMMRILHAIGVIDLLNRMLRPVLKLIGIGPKASAITVIGLTMGLSYGGGLIINEARQGTVDEEDIFYSLTLMGLCHSLIEDTLLLLLIGSQLTAILWGRLIFSLLVMAVVVQIVRRLPAAFRQSYLWVARQPQT